MAGRLRKLNGTGFITKRVTAESSFNDWARWLVRERQKRRPNGCWIVGINGSIGQGKSTFCAVMKDLLDAELKGKGRAVVRSLDDYYFPRAIRMCDEFLRLGYAPRGIPNRGPAGTHDVRRLLSDLRRLTQSG